ncbi:TadE/TadG family type IV pilus assembly protein [Brevundimonas variabilis]|uniref:Flp pilus assembly protein TadG n=1 Tax=Brevundimonas variabilis TaxID=74312 RepID=A0A7W9CF25_9CAUL|nr:TadE/TadG family type IV pilus assembly protein [Brevundimonas variabilis]MBB5744435.1 Flp pilus assembly protein TadG [Brevundimonas variabilis]
MATFWRTLEIGQAFVRFGQRFAASRRGNVAIIFAIVMPCLIMLTVGGVDLHRASTVRANLQDALDAAGLAAARSQYVTDEDLTRVGLAALRANLAAYPQITLREDLVTFTLDNDSVVIADATVDVRALVANIVLPPYGQILDDTLPVASHSEVNRSSKNIEVSLVLDVTGSMAGSRLAALKTASADLVELVVQDVQTPYTTRMAIIPYSVGVNLGSDATAARGSTLGATPITDASWAVGTAKTITGATRANPVVITATAHGFANDDYVWVRGVGGMSQINDKAFRVANKTANTFQLRSTNGTSYTAYTSGGTVTKCRVSDCSIVITSNNHGLAVNDPDNGFRQGAFISGVGGMTNINNTWFQIGNVTTNTFSIGVNGASYPAYTSGGSVICGRNGCPTRYFRSTQSSLYKTFPITTCSTERIGSEAYTDASPATSRTGRLYSNPAGTNLCPDAQIQPLTSVKSTLTDLIYDLEAAGSTAGHIGLAWGWYALSPSFNSLWSSNAANPYSTVQTIKTVIMMTDGEFNTNYCSGVLATNASFGGNDRIQSCNATNGTPYVQTAALCTAMKARGIIIYTVGFQIAADGAAALALRDCASSPSNAFISTSGSDLADDFAAIGRDITRLRISK